MNIFAEIIALTNKIICLISICQLDEIAIQIEESHEKFVVLAESLKARKIADLKRPEVK